MSYVSKTKVAKELVFRCCKLQKCQKQSLACVGEWRAADFNQSEPTCLKKKRTCHVALAVLANVQQFAITTGI